MAASRCLSNDFNTPIKISSVIHQRALKKGMIQTLDEPHETFSALGITGKTPLLRLRKNKTLISQLLSETAEKFQVKVYNNSLNSNHIHLLVKAPTQKSLHDFLRVLTGQIAQRITGAVRGKKNKVSFWLRPAWKRIVFWGRDFFNLHRYIYQNQLETLGLIPFQPRKRKRPPPD